MEVRCTVPVKLDVAESDAALLHDTIDQFRDAANYVVRHASDGDGYVITNKRLLHDRTYADVRDATDLHANLVQAARSRAVEALKSVVAKWRRGTYASLPHFTSPFLDFNAAKNVGFKLLRRLYTSSGGDAPVGVRINTGMMTTSGFTPAPMSGRVGVHGESPRR